MVASPVSICTTHPPGTTLPSHIPPPPCWPCTTSPAATASSSKLGRLALLPSPSLHQLASWRFFPLVALGRRVEANVTAPSCWASRTCSSPPVRSRVPHAGRAGCLTRRPHRPPQPALLSPACTSPMPSPDAPPGSLRHASPV